MKYDRGCAADVPFGQFSSARDLKCPEVFKVSGKYDLYVENDMYIDELSLKCIQEIWAR